MGQKTNPIGNRLGIIRGWESNWYGNKKDYATKLIEDNKIRNYLNARINKGGIAKIVIERTLNKLIVTIHTSKPGIIIGKGGGEVDRIKEELKKLTGKEDVQINILEIRRPELDANIVGETIAKQIENRINYKRAVKMAIASALRMGAEGIKVKVSGPLGGSEIARTEEIKQGRTPLHTFRMDIDYANLGKSFYEVYAPQKSNLHIPLKNGKSIILDNLSSPQIIGSLPSRYSSQDVDEFFSEMMVAVTKDNYKTEPYKTDFINILNKYSSAFGAKR
jgi:ribosomal protein S3